jgi:hypothetical protein
MTNAEMIVSRIRDPMRENLTQSDSSSQCRTGAVVFAGAVPASSRERLEDRLIIRGGGVKFLAAYNPPLAELKARVEKQPAYWGIGKNEYS